MDTQESLLNKLIAKTDEDSDFRDRLKADPRSVLKETFDIELADGFNLEVHEDDARTAHLVLPASAELTDAQLQQAAGGKPCPCDASAQWGGD